MSDFDGNFMETTSYWNPPASPSPRTIFEMLNQIDDVVNPIAEIFPQPTDQSEQRSGLGERLAARIEFTLPRLETDNISPFAAFFRNTNDVPSPMVPISPGFSPSALLQSPNMLSDSPQINPPSPVANYEPQVMVESCGEGNATTMISENDLPHYEPMNVALPTPQEGSDIPIEESVYIPSHESHVEPQYAPLDAPLVASFDTEVVDQEDNDDIADKQDVQASAPKRRKFETSSNMIGATRVSKNQRIIIQMESDEDHPDDGFRWRKYGQKVVKGNPNPRSYYKCTYEGCNVKKLVERGADDVNVVVTTYDGIHEHNAPVPRGSGSKFRSGPSMSSQDDQTNQTTQLGMPPSSCYNNPVSVDTTMTSTGPFTSLAPPMDMTQLYMTGLSKLPSLPVNQNTGFMYRNDEPRMDAIPNGTDVYKGIMNRLFLNFGTRF
ncbi:unnamed protein product [Arabis nemorensis]|uniref:WRKY domain-containing protein n=1 Tax=Arabis nemorensis TaxID=586526 RepID=A0A565BEY6_9BRAS|nr:unnamed protein product [Arabis nemorensis]